MPRKGVLSRVKIGKLLTPDRGGVKPALFLPQLPFATLPMGVKKVFISLAKEVGFDAAKLPQAIQSSIAMTKVRDL